MAHTKLIVPHEFEFSFDDSSHTVDQVISKLESMQKEFGKGSVSYIITEESFGILGIYRISSKLLRIVIPSPRKAGIFAKFAGIELIPGKYRYQKDLFNLIL